MKDKAGVISYTNHELRRITEKERNGTRAIFPDRGEQCPRCHTRVPVFSELPNSVRNHVLTLIRAGQKVEAMDVLQRETGCSGRWAKIWVLHAGKDRTCLWIDEQTHI